MRRLGTVLAELSHAVEYLPEEPETPVCAMCRGAGVILGAWQGADASLLVQVESVANARQRTLQACPACQTPEEKIRAANLIDIQHSTYPQSFASAVVACHALLTGERFSVWLRGEAGVGKTYLANDYGCRWVKTGRACCNVVAGDLLDRLRETNAPTAQENLRDILTYYATIPLLIIDDMGKERLTDFGGESMFKVIDRRHRENMATIVTSNLEAQISKPIASRLGVAFVLQGPDRRRG